MMRRTTVLALSLAVVVLGGCADRGSPDKTGVTTKVLRAVNVDSLNPNGQYPAPEVFLKKLTALSGGQLKVTIDQPFEEGEPTAETDELTAVTSGRYDLAWPSTRAYGNAGITSLQALEAPFLVTSMKGERAIVTSPLANEFLDTLHAHGLVGLGLAAGQLRRPMATKPLVTLADWAGRRVRTINSPTQEATIKALGARPVNASFHFPDLVEAGQLDGAEIDIATYDANDYQLLLPHATRNVVLWAKFIPFVMNARVYDGLTPQQQQWVRQAATAAVQASIDFKYDESTPALRMCHVGVRFHDATAKDLAALKAAAQPVTDRIAADPVSGPFLRKVRSAVTSPGIAGVTDVPNLPADCLR